MKKKFLYFMLLTIFSAYGLTAFAEDRWKESLKSDIVDNHIEFNPIPFSIPFKKIYPDFNRMKISITKDNWSHNLGFSVLYNKNNPEEYFLYRENDELIKFLLNKNNYKITSKNDIVKYISPVINLTEIHKISDTEYHLLNGKTFFDSKSGYILKIMENGEVKSIEEKMELKK